MIASVVNPLAGYTPAEAVWTVVAGFVVAAAILAVVFWRAK